MSVRTLYIMLVVMGIVLSVLAVTVSLSGCAVLEAGRDFLLGKPTIPFVPDTPKGQLWETIKGMTPNWLAIPVIALGVAVVYNGFRKLGVSCILFGSVNLFMGLATARFGFWMALFGFIAAMAALVASMLTKNKALRDIIGNIQDVKEIARDDNVDIVFQDKIKEVLAGQVKSTKKIVAKIKTKARAKGMALHAFGRLGPGK